MDGGQKMDSLLQVISVEELVLKAALESGDAFKGHYLYEEINKLAQEEELHRLTLWNQGTASQPPLRMRF